MPTISGPAPARLPGRGHPRLRRPTIGVAKADSVIEIELLEHAVRDVLNRTAPRRFGGPRPAQGGHRRTTPRARSRRWRSSTTPRTRPPGRARCRSARELWIERDDFMEEPAAEVLPAGARAARSGSGTRTSSPARRSSRTPQARSSSSAAPTTRRRAAATRPTAAGPRRRSTGSRRAHAVPAEVRLYDHLFTPARPGRRRRTCSRTSTRRPRPSSRARSSSRRLADAPIGETVQFERLGYFTPDPDSRARAARVQPDADAQGHVGQGPGSREGEPARLASRLVGRPPAVACRLRRRRDLLAIPRPIGRVRTPPSTGLHP